MLRVCVRFVLAAVAACGLLPQALASQLSISGAVDGNVMGRADAGIAPPVDISPIRQEVPFASSLPAGSILVKTAQRKLYFITGNGRALAYKVGVGREGFAWSGREKVTRKALWPDWRPPAEMIAREEARGHLIPELVRGGPANPLGAAALYIGSSAYRIHGTDKPWSIGQAASSGCIRMLNENVAELYRMAKVGALVVVE